YRADLYLRKPIDADSLVAQIATLIPLEAKARGEDATQLFSRDEIDAEIDAFAEDAFDSIFLDDDREEPQAAASATEALSSEAEDAFVEELDIDDALILEEEPVESASRSIPPPMPSVPPP